MSLPAPGQSRGDKQPQSTNRAVPVQKTEARSVVGQAKSAALSITNDFQRAFVLNQIGALEARCGDVNAAVETANRADPHNMAILTAIGEQLAQTNDLKTAQSLAPKLKGGGSSTVFYSYAARQCEGGHIADALHTTELIHAPEVRSGVLRSIAEHQARNGDYLGARKTMAAANAAYPAQPSSTEDVEIMIATAQIDRGESEAAHLTIASLKADMASFALIGGTEELMKEGDKANASLWLNEALQNLPQGERNDFIRYFAIPVLVKLGQKERAMQIVAAFSPEMKVKGYGAIAVAAAEARDIELVNTVVEKMHAAGAAKGKSGDTFDSEARLQVLNLSAALIDADEFDAAAHLLASVERAQDEVSKMTIQVESQLQHAVIFAQQGDFERARSVALTMRPDSVADVQRGTALRITAFLQTRKSGIPSAQPWALALKDAEDRAYSLLGIAQALLDAGDVKLPYNAIQIH